MRNFLRKSQGAHAEDQTVESNHKQFLPILLPLRGGRVQGQGEMELCGFPESLTSGLQAPAQAAGAPPKHLWEATSWAQRRGARTVARGPHRSG